MRDRLYGNNHTDSWYYGWWWYRVVDNEMSYFRKVIRIKAEHSPNVRLALKEIACGKIPSHLEIIKGVLPYRLYVHRRATWDAIRQCIGLDAEFYEGAEQLLFPPTWLNHAEHLANVYSRERRNRKVKAIGIDPAEGGDKTSMIAIDELGLIDLVSKKTPDTSVIPNEAIAFCHKHGLTDFSNLVFDRGGGGKQAADLLRSKGYVGVRTVAFGETIVKEVDDTSNRRSDNYDLKESNYEYKNRRAQMYGELSEALDPSLGLGFSLPEEFNEIRNQLSPIPKMYDPEGRLILPPKNKRNPDSKELTLVDLIGHSPDEADALVLAYHILIHKPKKKIAKWA